MGLRTVHECSGPGRTQSEVIGVVLLFGIVAAVSIGLLVVAAPQLSGIVGQADQERVENELVEFSSAMATAAQDGEVSQSAELQVSDGGEIAKADDGTMRISAGSFYEDYNLETIKYESSSGSTVAYQGGAVFRGSGDEVRIVSSPEIYFDRDERSLSMTIMEIDDASDVSSGSLNLVREDAEFVDEIAELEEGDEVTITIESEYYLGWKDYFESEAGVASVQDVDRSNDQITVVLGYSDIQAAFDEDATISPEGNLTELAGSSGYIDTYENGTYYPPLDDEIEQIATDARNADGPFEGVTNLSDEGVDQLSEANKDDPDDGMYYTDNLGDEDLYFNLSEGDATLVVDDDMILTDGGITVTGVEGTDNALRIYTTGNTLALDSEICVDDCGGEINAKHILLFGTSDLGINFGSGFGGTFEGVMYASAHETSEDWHDDGFSQCDMGEDGPQFILQAEGEVSGSITVHSVCAQAASSEYEYDDELRGMTIDIYPEGYEPYAQTTYLNINNYEMRVDG